MALQANYGLPTPELETLLRLDQEVQLRTVAVGEGGGDQKAMVKKDRCTDDRMRWLRDRAFAMFSSPPPNDISAIVSVLADVVGKLKRTDLCPTDLCLTDLCPTQQQPEKTKR